MRLRIAWTEGRYKVSVPNYEGGEVVTAEYHDRRVNELLDAAERLVYLLCGDQEDEEEIDRGIGVPGAGDAINRLREAIGKEEEK